LTVSFAFFSSPKSYFNDLLDQDQGAGDRPTFTQAPQVRMFEESILLECRCTADPVPSFIWTLEGKAIAASAKYRQGILSEGNTHTIFLEISQIGPKDTGAYKVTAKNAKGDGAANIQLNIEGIQFKFVERIFLDMRKFDFDFLIDYPKVLHLHF
jgi:hypothetical protein